MDALDLHIQEIILSFAKVPITALVCRSMRDTMPNVYKGLVVSGDVRSISELSNRSLVLDLLHQFGPEIVHWCHEAKLSIVHLLHPKISLDHCFCDLALRLTSGFAFELLPCAMRKEMDLVMLALHASNGLAFMYLDDSLQTNPDVCRVCLNILQLPALDHVVDDGSFSNLAILTIIHTIREGDFPGYDLSDPLYHRRTNNDSELGLSRSLASDDIGWRCQNLYSTILV